MKEILLMKRKYLLHQGATLIIVALVMLVLMYCDAPAQEQYYEIQWDLNTDGVTYEYLMFMWLGDDTTAVPFYDSLFTYPDDQWSQFMFGSYNHDSLFAVDPDIAVVEFIPSAGANPKWIGLALFAKSPDGFYSDRAVYVHGEAIPAFIRPNAVNRAGIIVTRKTRWK
jgi:hypothetical protein